PGVVAMGARPCPPRTRAGSIVKRELLDVVFAQDHLANLDVAERRLALRALLAQQPIKGSLEELADWIDGLGPLSAVMRDPAVTDVLVNGPHQVWVERDGRLNFEGALFESSDDLLRLVERLLGDAGAHADASHPIADARLAGGARIHVVLPPVAPRGPVVSIRRFPGRPLSLDDLRARGMFGDEHASALEAAVRERLTIAISGGTGTGKTTLLNALLGCVGDGERVIVIEETAELQPPCRHAVSLVARPGNVEGRGEVDLESLVRAALRMRPDRIVVGEVRGPEALAALDALSTGHPGSMFTIHAHSGRDALARIVSLALGARTGRSQAALREEVHAAIDVTVHLGRGDGTRRVASVTRLR
ncbi:MAG: Flp pilus assembly complex ATPase component TadA, partial [Actinomycetota bacterium]|nr:Flp pilus assembly complex ATPase component TadA [Actinomycetota bacterium]